MEILRLQYGDSVGRVWRECGYSVGRMCRYCGLVGRECGERFDTTLNNCWEWVDKVWKNIGILWKEIVVRVGG